MWLASQSGIACRRSGRRPAAVRIPPSSNLRWELSHLWAPAGAWRVLRSRPSNNFAIRYLPRKHGVDDGDILHAIAHVVAESDDDEAFYLCPDRAGNLLEVVVVIREDETEVVIHAMRMRRIYESLLREIGDADD